MEEDEKQIKATPQNPGNGKRRGEATRGSGGRAAGTTGERPGAEGGAPRRRRHPPAAARCRRRGRRLRAGRRRGRGTGEEGRGRESREGAAPCRRRPGAAAASSPPAGWRSGGAAARPPGAGAGSSPSPLLLLAPGAGCRRRAQSRAGVGRLPLSRAVTAAPSPPTRAALAPPASSWKPPRLPLPLGAPLAAARAPQHRPDPFRGDSGSTARLGSRGKPRPGTAPCPAPSLPAPRCRSRAGRAARCQLCQYKLACVAI